MDTELTLYQSMVVAITDGRSDGSANDVVMGAQLK